MQVPKLVGKQSNKWEKIKNSQPLALIAGGLYSYMHACLK